MWECRRHGRVSLCGRVRPAKLSFARKAMGEHFESGVPDFRLLDLHER